MIINYVSNESLPNQAKLFLNKYFKLYLDINK